jgi:hypothetical protein
MNEGCLTKRSSVKQFILDYATRTRPTSHFTRVSQETVDRVEAAVREACRQIVQSAPTRRTL